MVAQIIHPAPERRALRMVETMVAPADEPRLPEPTPLRRVRNTIRCKTQFCGVPLMQITTDNAYIPLHASPLHYLKPTPHFLLTCPNCGAIRKVEQR